ncbi:hypothetical protein BDR26DRAFT_915882 [Obelidium mucronatum]|nr:hypothetical protein BDR26DRAFT_915882 [Obelidium mucronatum]
MIVKTLWHNHHPASELEETLYVPRRHHSIDELKELESNSQFDVMAIVYAASESVVCLIDSTLALLQVQDYNRGFKKIQVGDVVCLKNLEYLHKDQRMHYSRFQKHFGVLEVALSKTEKDIKSRLIKFRFIYEFDILRNFPQSNASVCVSRESEEYKMWMDENAK